MGDLFKAARKRVLLLAIFAFAFVYRIVLLFWQTYPPGSDIGFHASVINSITQAGNTNFMYNFYQMGGGVELEFPGYHIFAAEVIGITGMPSYLAQALIVALFSSLIVLAIFLVTRIVWDESAALIAAFFVAISRFDIEILCWGGYPNIVGLLLIPLTFYLFFKRDKTTRVPFLVSTSLLVASIFLAHSLSAAIFVSVAAISMLVALIFPSRFNESRRNSLYLASPIFVGAALVSPFLASAIPPYLNESAAFTGASAVEQALVSQRTVPFAMTLGFFVCVALLFLLPKKYRGRLLSLPVSILFIWLLVPLLLTQDYVVGVYVDSVRFLYFLIYPAIIILGVLTAFTLRYIAQLLHARRHSNLKDNANRSHTMLRSRFSAINCRKVYPAFLLGLLPILLFGLPIFRFPWNAGEVQSFYQVMNDPGYQSIQWVKQNTPENSMFVSDFHYGWWLAGVGQRPTITDVDMQVLSLAREVNIAKNSSYLLDTDYIIDNGYLQLREDGGFIGRHNPLITADTDWAHEPEPFILFNNNAITLSYRNDQLAQSINISHVPVANMQLVSAQTPSPSIIISRASNGFNYTEILTLSKGLKFANITFMVQSNSQKIVLDSLSFFVEAIGLFRQEGDTLAILDARNNACTQMIFAENQPEVTLTDAGCPCKFELTYNLQGKTAFEIQILTRLQKVSTEEIETQLQAKKPPPFDHQNAQTPIENSPITTFDYRKALQEYGISYVVNRNFELNSKFAKDPAFSLVFHNDEVSIFRVNPNATMAKG